MNAAGIVLPRLETERLLLRPFLPEDVDFVLRHFGDPAVHRYFVDADPITEREEAEDFLRAYVEPKDATYGRWVVIWKADSIPIGTCGFDRYDARHRRFEINYDLSPAYWGQGITVEALRAMLRYGFERLNLNRVEALVYPENVGSIRVLEKLGFQREGLFRDFFCQGDKFYDHLFFSLLRREWAG